MWHVRFYKFENSDCFFISADVTKRFGGLSRNGSVKCHDSSLTINNLSRGSSTRNSFKNRKLADYYNILFIRLTDLHLNELKQFLNEEMI